VTRAGPLRLAAGAGVLAGGVLIAVGVRALPTAATPQAIPAPRVTAGSVPAPARVALAATGFARPDTIRIPAIGVSAPVVPVGVNRNRTLQVPPLTNRNLAGWYDGGAAPGQRGPAVIVGHVDSYLGPSVFYRLHELRPGEHILVGRHGAGPLTFTVSRLQQVSKAHFPTASVYGPAAGPQLRLITCGGAFDSATGHYLDNLIVYGHLSATS
jgi:sortase (surface protein transpeptidase)